MGLRSRTRFTKSKRQPKIRPFLVPPSLFREKKTRGASPDLKFREASKLSPFGCGTHHPIFWQAGSPSGPFKLMSDHDIKVLRDRIRATSEVGPIKSQLQPVAHQRIRHRL
jgi:hypothetical protein